MGAAVASAVGCATVLAVPLSDRRSRIRGGRWMNAVVACAVACAALPAAGQKLEHTVQAPHYGDTLFHFFQDRHFEAITGLMVSQHFGRVRPHEDEAEVLRGGMLLSYGLHREAGEVFAQLIDRHAAPQVRDRAWYFLARIRYQRGLPAEADAALAKVAAPLEGGLEDDRQLLAAQVRLALGDATGAAQILAKVPPESLSAPFARFNLGVALIRGGDTAKGRQLLAELGLKPAADEEQRSLRDRANVALGFAALADHQPQDARAALQRVRLAGAQSNKALLGFGWAAAEMKQPRDALAPWTELAGRDIGDAAVLEARIALPYAYAELGADGQALDGYNQAVAQYQAERQRLDESIRAIRSGVLLRALLDRNPSETLGGAAGIQDLPDMPHAGHLTQLLAGHEFQESFKNLRDLQFVDRNLSDWQGRLGVFDDMLANRRQAYQQRLPAVLQHAGENSLPKLQERREMLAGALAHAEADTDTSAFVDARERGLLARLQRVQAGLAQSPDVELAERLRRVAGALTWQLAQDYPARVWEAKKSLRATDRLLAEAGGHSAALAQAQKDEPARFDDFARRIASLASRLKSTLPRVAALDREQHAQLQEVAVAQLQQQQERLDIYAAQARLAIAQLLDRAQLAQGSAQASEVRSNAKR
jgi:hypothetical protein